MDSFERLQEPQLPPKDAFFHLTEKDYTHAQRVFNHFSMTDLKDYHKFYLLTGVLLQADVFENFRDMCLQYYGLHPAHNYTFPDLSWKAALKIKDVELDLLTDTEQHLFIEEGIRGGMAIISHQYAQANAPEMGNYNASKRNSYITYLHANNLYGWVL